ncbi:MAG: plastocyanin/azurin family copper-binding protein, partial [Candidatus Levybacteria bacterium]|nr:plastocyanin/azurin family copper-binding protein [Candidatus Levybacteria bacterium]
VKITFKNTQGFHNFLIDEFDVKSKTIPVDQTDEISFIANKKGAFQFYCSVGNHKAMGMVGTLTVR